MVLTKPRRIREHSWRMASLAESMAEDATGREASRTASWMRACGGVG